MIGLDLIGVRKYISMVHETFSIFQFLMFLRLMLVCRLPHAEGRETMRENLRKGERERERARERGNANISRWPTSKGPWATKTIRCAHTHIHTLIDILKTVKTEGEVSLPIHSHHIKYSKSENMSVVKRECTSMCECVCLFMHNEAGPEMWMAIKCKWINRMIWSNIAMHISACMKTWHIAVNQAEDKNLIPRKEEDQHHQHHLVSTTFNESHVKLTEMPK